MIWVYTDKLEENNGALGRLISRNDQHHRYAETGDEFFMLLVVNYHTGLVEGKAKVDDLHKTMWDEGKGRHTGYAEVLGCPNMLEALLKTMPMKWYYTDTRLFQPFWVAKNIVGKFRGVSDYI